MQYRYTSSGCRNCSSEIPIIIEKNEEHGYTEYCCPDCLETILEGVVSTNGEPANVSPSKVPASVQHHNSGIRRGLNWSRWEAWWTDRFTVVAIHGIPVHGKKELLDYVERVQDAHDDS